MTGEAEIVYDREGPRCPCQCGSQQGRPLLVNGKCVTGCCEACWNRVLQGIALRKAAHEQKNT